MTTTFQVRSLDPIGNHLLTVSTMVDAEGVGLDYVLTCNPGGIGVLELTVPATIPLAMFPKDGRLLPYRSIAGRPYASDNQKVYLIRKRESHASYSKITAYDATSILMRRIIAYYAGSSDSDKAAAPADDQIKAFARTNLTTAGTTTRRGGLTTTNLFDVSAYLTIAANLGGGVNVAKAAAWRNLHEVATELAAASTAGGTYCTFEIVAPTDSTLELRTSTVQRGVNHRATSAQPVIFAADRGNAENIVLTEDWTEEVTYPYIGGAGDGIYRQIGYSFFAAPVLVSDVPFGRIETFTEMTNTADQTVLTDAANSLLWQGRPTVTMRADLVETPAATRGIHYDLGDYVTMQHRGVQYDLRLDTIHVQAGQPAPQSIALTRQRILLRGDVTV